MHADAGQRPTFFNAYAALTSPTTQTIAESRKSARGASLYIEHGDGDVDDLGLGISSGIKRSLLRRCAGRSLTRTDCHRRGRPWM